ncbi:MAG: hypothetical protein HC838_17325 [Spirulinaceae cyanobacterium RM2_2_10]|nr:hypothetical protein [Spirulinaceae cyanobacterium RM2_2_10]
MTKLRLATSGDRWAISVCARTGIANMPSETKCPQHQGEDVSQERSRVASTCKQSYHLE